MTRKLFIAALGGTALALTVPSAASARGVFSVTIGSGGYGSGYGGGYGGGYPVYSRHDRQHDQIEDRHEGGHEQLEEGHEEAHDQGLSRREHRDLHHDLEYQHEVQDYRLARQHQSQHRRNSWQRRYYNNGYGGHRY